MLLEIKGKPVLYTVNINKKYNDIPADRKTNFNVLIGSDKSLKKCIQQAKAAMLYPPQE